jgi:hypothetical protein
MRHTAGAGGTSRGGDVVKIQSRNEHVAVAVSETQVAGIRQARLTAVAADFFNVAQ